MPILECAISVLLDGGDLAEELRAWCSLLSRTPGYEQIAKETARWIAKAEHASKGRPARKAGRP